MKKFYMLAVALLCVVTLQAQTNDYVTKNDFKTENQKLTAQINAAKAPSYQLKVQLTNQQLTIDSLSQLISTLLTEKVTSITRIENLEIQAAMVQEQLNNTQLNTRSKVIYLLVIIALGGLILLGLFYFIWKKSEKNHKLLSQDLEKTNAALNLHIQNNEEDLALLRESIEKQSQESKRGYKELKTLFEQEIITLTAQIGKLETVIDEKNRLLKSDIEKSILAIDAKLGAMNTSIQTNKETAENTAKETALSLAKTDQQLTKSLQDMQSKWMLAEEQHKAEFDKVMKKLAELATTLSEHNKKGH